MLRGQNKFFDESKAQHTNSEFTDLYISKEFEKKKCKDLVKMMTEDQPDQELKK